MGTKHIEGDLYIKDNKVYTIEKYTVILAASKWLNNEQEVYPSVSPTNIVIVSPADDPKAYAEAGIYCSKQENGVLTFTCETTPTTNINVNFLIMR